MLSNLGGKIFEILKAGGLPFFPSVLPGFKMAYHKVKVRGSSEIAESLEVGDFVKVRGRFFKRLYRRKDGTYTDGYRIEVEQRIGKSYRTIYYLSFLRKSSQMV
jgi:hypothetical protein